MKRSSCISAISASVVVLLIAAAARPAAAQSAGSLSGQIVDARTHATLDAAEITLEGDGAPLMTRSGADGRWSLDSVPEGHHRLVVRRLGYLAARRPMEVGPTLERGIVVELTLSPRPLDAIVVTAARRDRSSFGCNASMRFTVFDECILRAIDRGLLWQTVMDHARACVAQHEQDADYHPPSEPQLFIGPGVAQLTAFPR